MVYHFSRIGIYDRYDHKPIIFPLLGHRPPHFATIGLTYFYKLCIKVPHALVGHWPVSRMVAKLTALRDRQTNIQYLPL